MKQIPAVRAQMGIWVYYVSAMSFSDVAKYVKPIDDELHRSSLLRETIQRSITDNYKSIASYLIDQDERFFNALILAVYDGSPMWSEIKLDEEVCDYSLGLLSLSGEEKIFPVDGQHRVAGIKRALEGNSELRAEMVPVVFISHATDPEGMQRTRRMFSTLNRYAKPVTMRDIIALDEDDVVAIVSRNLLDDSSLFGEQAIFDAKGKSLPESNTTAMTSLITFYECNKELLWLMIKDYEVKSADNKVVKAKGTKTDEYLRHRPPASLVTEFDDLCKDYWQTLLSKCLGYTSGCSVGEYRCREGGHLFFRPISLKAFTKAVVEISCRSGEDTAKIIKEFRDDVLWLTHPVWKRVLWDSIQKKMIMGQADLIKNILIYSYDKSLLSPKEVRTINVKLASAWDASDEENIATRLIELFG